MNWPLTIGVLLVAAMFAAIIVSTLRGMAQCASPEGSAGCCDCAAQGKPGPRRAVS